MILPSVQMSSTDHFTQFRSFLSFQFNQISNSGELNSRHSVKRVRCSCIDKSLGGECSPKPKSVIFESKSKFAGIERS
jgi:hypothetical protein